MKKKLLTRISFLIVVILLASLAFIILKPIITDMSLSHRFSEFNIQYKEKHAQGYDVTEAETFSRKAEQAFNRKDYNLTNKFLDEAFGALESPKIPSILNKSWLYEGPIYVTHPYYYDGTFKGLTKQIPTMADLGVKTIWLMPIWEHEPLPPEGSRFRYGFIYHTLNHYKISSEFGTEEELKELVNTVHKYNMRIIFDLVTCCTYVEGIAYNNNWTLSTSLSELHRMGLPLEYTKIDGIDYVYSNCVKDKYMANMYKCDIFGSIVGDEVKLLTYPHPGYGYAIDRTNPEAVDYFTKVAEYYIREYDIDGWRIDYPVNLWNPKIISEDHSIITLLRSVKNTTTKIKPDAILLAEDPALIPYSKGTPPNPVLDEIIDISNSYYFQNNILNIIKNKILSEEHIRFIGHEKIWFNKTRTRSVELPPRQRVNEILPHLNKPLLVLISTTHGVPMIQAGQEVGATNVFLKNASVDWANGDYELRKFYKKVFEIRNNHNALRYGSIKNVWKAEDDTYAYLRSYEDDEVVIVINFQGKTVSSDLNLPYESGVFLFDELNNESFVVDDPNNFKITMPAYGSRILVLDKKE